MVNSSFEVRAERPARFWVEWIKHTAARDHKAHAMFFTCRTGHFGIFKNWTFGW